MLDMIKKKLIIKDKVEVMILGQIKKGKLYY